MLGEIIFPLARVDKRTSGQCFLMSASPPSKLDLGVPVGKNKARKPMFGFAA
jgi:hypothetical protein